MSHEIATKTQSWFIPEANQFVSWHQDFIDSEPELMWKEEPHIKGCGNPWNWICKHPQLETEIRNGKPNYQPSRYYPALIQIHFLDHAEIRRHFASIIGADCWAVFLRDARTHKPVHVYYDSIICREETEVREQLYSEEETPLQSELIDKLTKDANLELVLVLGQCAFATYVYKSVAPDKFVFVRMDAK